MSAQTSTVDREMGLFGLAAEDGALERFYIFGVLTVILAIFLVYYLFFSAKLLGYMISVAINARINRWGHIRIGSIHFALLGGTICVRDVIFCSKNITVRIVDGYVSIRWWKAWAENTALVRVTASGLEYCILNNSTNYDK